jgi:hypothetical protein
LKKDCSFEIIIFIEKPNRKNTQNYLEFLFNPMETLSLVLFI